MGRILCDQICFGEVLTSGLLTHAKTQGSLINNTPGKGIYDNSQYISRQIRVDQRVSLHLPFSNACSSKIINLAK